jgi:hypothetical protein
MSAFWRIMSASPAGADLPDGVAEGPFLTRSCHSFSTHLLEGINGGQMYKFARRV